VAPDLAEGAVGEGEGVGQGVHRSGHRRRHQVVVRRGAVVCVVLSVVFGAQAINFANWRKNTPNICILRFFAEVFPQ